MNTDNDIDKIKLEERIFELYGSAQMFFDWSKKYRNLYNELKPNDIWEKQAYISNDLAKYLIINCNLYLFYSINIIATLLSKKQEKIEKKELSLFEHIELLNDEMKTKANENLKILRSLYEESGLDIFRNKIIAHKDLKTSGYPVTHLIESTNSIFYDKTEELISKIIDYLKLYNLNGCVNNYSKEYFDKCHSVVLDMIKNKLVNNI